MEPSCLTRGLGVGATNEEKNLWPLSSMRQSQSIGFESSEKVYEEKVYEERVMSYIMYDISN